MFDLALNKKGDIILHEKINNRKTPVSLSFFIAPVNAISLKFSFNNINNEFNNKTSITFSINNQNVCLSDLVLKNEDALKQLCYNALRTQKNSATSFGSNLWQYRNKPIQKNLKAIEKVAHEALRDFLPNAKVEAITKRSQTGECILQFNIIADTHKINLEL